MKFEVDRKFTITLTDEEANSIAGDLFNYINGYRGGSGSASRELLAWLGSRNERVPSGTVETKVNPTEW